MTKREPDWDKIHEIARRAEALKGSGRLDYTTYRALLDEVEVASNGNPQHTDILTSLAKPEWIDRLYQEEQEAKRAGRKKKRPAA